MSNEVHFAWISLTHGRKKSSWLLDCEENREELISRSQRLGTSLLFTVMVLSISERQMPFCLHIGLRSQTALAFDLLLVGSAFDMPTDGKRSQRVGGTIGYGSWISWLAVHSTCPQTVSAHNVSEVRLGTGLGSVYFNR